MRLPRCLCLVLAFAVIFCALFSVSAYAAKVETYSFNGVVLPKLPSSDLNYVQIYEKASQYYVCFTLEPKTLADTSSITGMQVSGFGGNLYRLLDGAWVSYSPTLLADLTLIWSNYDLYNASGTLLFQASDPIVTWVETPVVYSDIQPVLGAFGDQINVPLVIGVLAGIAGVGVVFVFLWWAARKVSGGLMRAFRKGKLRL